MTEYTDGLPNEGGPPLTAEDTALAKGPYHAFFEANKEGITHVDYSTRTYYIVRGWSLRGPIPKGVNIEHIGLANTRRVGKVKRRKYR